MEPIKEWRYTLSSTISKLQEALPTQERTSKGIKKQFVSSSTVEKWNVGLKCNSRFGNRCDCLEGMKIPCEQMKSFRARNSSNKDFAAQ